MFSPEDIAKLDQLAQLACAAPDEYSILDVAAVGLVEKVWRSSPLEDMHASRRGPSDGEMFAESAALHRVTRDVLATRGRCRPRAVKHSRSRLVTGRKHDPG